MMLKSLILWLKKWDLTEYKISSHFFAQKQNRLLKHPFRTSQNSPVSGFVKAEYRVFLRATTLWMTILILLKKNDLNLKPNKEETHHLRKMSD